MEGLHASHRPLRAVHRAIHHADEPVGGFHVQPWSSFIWEGQDVVASLAGRQNCCRHLAVTKPRLLVQIRGHMSKARPIRQSGW